MVFDVFSGARLADGLPDDCLTVDGGQATAYAVGPALFVTLAAVFSARPQQLAAAPHLVAPTAAVRDFYDADWPEVYLIVMAKCVSCHRPGTEQNDYTSHAKIMAARTEDGEPIVVPGSPQRSPLYKQVIWNVNAQRDSKLPDEPLIRANRLALLAALARHMNRVADLSRLSV